MFLALAVAWCVLNNPLNGSRCLAVSDVVVAAYNLENYTLQSSQRVHAKSERAKEAVARVIAEVHPDILGLCEVGSMEAVEELRERLRAKGVDFLDVEMVEGPDLDRHLVLLSRFPLVSRRSNPRVSYELNGVPQLVRRGFLDVTAAIGARYQLRLVGVHLKSKLPIPEGESVVRRYEAQLLRERVDGILREEPSVNLLVYGDMNDTRETPVIREILGEKGGAFGLLDLPAQDAFGDRWTHYWRAADIYSRIDYLLVNRGLWPEVHRGSARLTRNQEWRDASDHRIISISITPVDK